LDEAGAASFERHVASCNDCAREVRELAQLESVLGALAPTPLSPLEERRMRAELLRKAHAHSIARAPARRFVWLAAAGLFVLALLALGLRGWRTLPASFEARPVFELRPLAGARMHDATKGASARVVLEAGSVAAHVQHLQAGQRFVMNLPDGELEVLGTRFFVQVDGGITRRVVVTEGVVALRLRDLGEHVVAAGESWTRPQPEAHAPESGVAGTTSAPSASADAPESHLSHPRPAPPEVGAAEAHPTPGAEFGAAMAAFDAGHYADADARFARFTAQHPSEARAEDAFYLRAVIASKQQDATAAAARAHEYLARFPNGLRRTEMERLAASR
jgi:TolA-binding protein